MAGRPGTRPARVSHLPRSGRWSSIPRRRQPYAAGGNRQLFKSTDGAASWVGIAVDIGDRLAIAPSSPLVLYAGGYGAVSKSTDGGMTWNPASSGLPQTANLTAVVINPSTPNTVYAATERDGVFKSLNGGGNWTPASTGLSNLQVLALTIDPLTPSTLYAGTNGGAGLFKSTDGGASWVPANRGFTDLRVDTMAVTASAPPVLYAGTPGGVARSGDSGGSWTLTSFTGPTFALAVDPSAPTTLYAGTDPGVFKSVDGGASWTAAKAGLGNLSVQALAIDPVTPSTLYAGAENIVFKSVDGAQSWIPLPVISLATVSALAIDPAMPTTLYAGYDGGVPLADRGVFKSLDGGVNWAKLPGVSVSDVDRVHALLIDPAMPTRIYAVVNQTLFRSTDGGFTWDVQAQLATIALDPSTPGTLYGVSVDGGLSKSADGGGTWSFLTPQLPFPGGASPGQLLVDPVVPARLYAGTSRAGVFELLQAPLITLALHVTGFQPTASSRLVGSPRNGALFHPGETLQVDVTVSNVTPPVTVDVYLAVILPPALGRGLGVPAGMPWSSWPRGSRWPRPPACRRPSRAFRRCCGATRSRVRSRRRRSPPCSWPTSPRTSRRTPTR
jgi:photosystem II stability/assembly factor-like uncharacterized protein